MELRTVQVRVLSGMCRFKATSPPATQSLCSVLACTYEEGEARENIKGGIVIVKVSVSGLFNTSMSD